MPSQKRKLCLITNRYPANPDDTASPFVRDFHLALIKRGVEVLVFTPAYAARVLDTPDRVYRFGWAGGNRTVGELNLLSLPGLYQLFSFLREGKNSLFDLVARERPSHCLALWALPSGWFARNVNQEFGIPYSVWCLGSDIYVWAGKPLFRHLTKTVLKQAQHLFADGFDLAGRVTKLSGKPCRFLPSQRVLPRIKTDQACLLDKKFQNFLYLGRWEKSKGLADLVYAFRQVADQNPKARLHIIGWGSYERDLRQLVGNLGLHHFIKMIGKVDTPTLSCYLKNCDWVVIPSQGDSIPLVLSEAIQFRKPVVVTEVGDLGKLTREYNLGKVAPPGQPDRLADAMLEVTRDKKDYTKRMPELLKVLSIDQAADSFLKTLNWETDRSKSKPGAKHQVAV